MSALVARIVATTNTRSRNWSFTRTVTLYRIHVRQWADHTRSWCVLRRYSEFDDLYQALCKTLPASALPVLPPKLLLNTADALADRYLDLDAFLRSLLSMPTAAQHPRLRSFLGADVLFARGPIVQHTRNGVAADAGTLEDDWEHEASVLSPARPSPASGSGDDQPPSTPPSTSAEPTWLLTGSWVADEARSRDSLEPMLRAMGTPWAARRMVRDVRIVSTLRHEAGISLVEIASSSLGEGKPSVFALDGKSRPLWMGRREGSVRAVELRRTGAVRLEITLPDGKGAVLDTRRVLPSGDELERIIELRLVRQPPLRLHRLLVRDPEKMPQPPVPRPRPPATPKDALTVTAGGVDSPARSPAAHLEAAAVRAAQRQRMSRAGGGARSRRLYRHERVDMVLRAALYVAWRVLCALARVLRSAPMTCALLALSLTAHGYCSGLLPHRLMPDRARGSLASLSGIDGPCNRLVFAVIAPTAAAGGASPPPPEVSQGEVALVSSKAALGEATHGEAALTSSPPIIYQIQTPTLMLALDALTAMAGLRAIFTCRRHE